MYDPDGFVQKLATSFSCENTFTFAYLVEMLRAIEKVWSRRARALEGMRCGSFGGLYFSAFVTRSLISSKKLSRQMYCSLSTGIPHKKNDNNNKKASKLEQRQFKWYISERNTSEKELIPFSNI